MVRTLQTLADRDPDTLETRARRDFAEQPFFDEEMSREDLFNLLSVGSISRNLRMIGWLISAAGLLSTDASVFGTDTGAKPDDSGFCSLLSSFWLLIFSTM